jgi:hypothetical protein
MGDIPGGFRPTRFAEPRLQEDHVHSLATSLTPADQP